MQNMEHMDIDQIVEVPDTPDRLPNRHVIGRESVGQERNSPLLDDSRHSNLLCEKPMRGLRRLFTGNGQSRSPSICPPKNFRKLEINYHSHPNDVFPIGNSSASQNALLVQGTMDRSSGQRTKHSTGAHLDNGKTICTKVTLKPSFFQEGSKVFDLTRTNGHTQSPKMVCSHGTSKDLDVRDINKREVVSIGSSSERCLPDSLKKNVHENAFNCPNPAMAQKEVFDPSNNFQHGTGEELSVPQSVSSHRGSGKRLVKNGLICPVNIERVKQSAEQHNSCSRNVGQSQVGNQLNNSSCHIEISDIIAENNNGERVKGKGVLNHPSTSKGLTAKFSRASSSGSLNGQEETSVSSCASRDAFGYFEGLSGWRTHDHSLKPDYRFPNAASNLSKGLEGRDYDRRDYHLYKQYNARNQHADDRVRNQHADQTADRFVSELEQSFIPHVAKKINSKRQKKQGLSLRTHSGCSTSISMDSDVVFLGSSEESSMSRSSRVPSRQSRDISGHIELDELSPAARCTAPQSLDPTSNGAFDVRARQVEADEILARELQEQLYYEEPVVGVVEIDEHVARALQEAENDRFTSTSRSRGNQNQSHERDLLASHHYRQLRTRSSQNPSNRRGTQGRVPTSTRMAQLRGRYYRQSPVVSRRARNLGFPLDMDLDTRTDILEALEAAAGDFSDVETAHFAFGAQRDFNENDYEMLLALDEDNHHHSGASVHQINSLPRSTVESDTHQETCAICLETPAIGETVRHLPCLHKFHKDCIDPWLSQRTSCPICKSSIT